VAEFVLFRSGKPELCPEPTIGGSSFVVSGTVWPVAFKKGYPRPDNIDIDKSDIHSCCKACGREFTVTPRAGERIEEVLSRLRDEYNSHNCTASNRK
jgi:hypothetical protein